MTTIEEKYILARWYYKTGKPIMSDDDYNQLHRTMCELGKLPEYTSRPWSDDPKPDVISSDEPEIKITFNKLKIGTGSMESIDDFSHLKSLYESMNETHQLSLKLDGWNCQAWYVNTKFNGAESRGRSGDSLNLERIKEFIPMYIDSYDQVNIVGELCLSEDNFNILSRENSDRGLTVARSAVSSAISLNRFDLLNFIAFSAYKGKNMLSAIDSHSFLKDNGFDTVPIYYVRNYQELISQLQVMSEDNSYKGIRSDGVVIRNVKTNEMRAIRLYSWKSEIMKSYVTGYTDNYGKFDVGISCQIYPVKTKQGLQKKVNCYNLHYIVENKLDVGAPIAFKRQSDATAVLDVENTNLLQMQYWGRFDEYRSEILFEENLK